MLHLLTTGCGTSRTSRDARLESGKRAKADIDQVAVTDRMGADIISTGAKLADLAANDWDIVAPARMHFQFARRRICRVLAFSSFAETASRSSSPPSSLEASNSVRHALARTAGDTAEQPAIIFKTRTGSRSSGATSGTVTLRGRPPRFRRGFSGVFIASTITGNPLACTDFSAAWVSFWNFHQRARPTPA